MQELFERLAKARRDAGFEDATAAARRFGWNENTYRSHENGQRGFRRDTAAVYAKAFRVSSGWLMSGEGENRLISVPVMGRIGAGAEIDVGVEQVPPEGYYGVQPLHVSLPSDAIAFEVVGVSMYPRYNEGDVVICSRRGEPLDEIPDGGEAAVRTADGRRFLKHIFRADVAGVFNLMSHNAAPILAVRLEWASPVLTIIPARQWARLDSGERQRFREAVNKRG